MNILREESQKHHESMLLLHRKADDEREKANQAHAKFVEYLGEVKKVEQELDDVSLQVRGIRDGLRADDLKVERDKMAKVNARVEALRQEAQRKMAAGEKLSFDDLQFIYGGKAENDDDEEEAPKAQPKQPDAF
jgi:phosphoserine phosphatase